MAEDKDLTPEEQKAFEEFLEKVQLMETPPSFPPA